MGVAGWWMGVAGSDFAGVEEGHGRAEFTTGAGMAGKMRVMDWLLGGGGWTDTVDLRMVIWSMCWSGMAAVASCRPWCSSGWMHTEMAGRDFL